MAARTPGQMLALAVLGGLVSTFAAVIVFDLLATRREAAANAPLPGPIVPGFGTA